MDSVYGQDVAMSIDMDELGVRPLNWIDISKDFDDSINDYFGKEKTVDFTVYSAELQLTNNGKKLTTDEEDDPFMSNDDDSQDYEIDPETGEKIFRPTAFASNISFSSQTDKWIEEYLSNIESSSNQILPTTTTNNSEFILENIPFPLLENTNEQTDPDWLSSIINLDENSESIMFADPTFPNEFIDNNENKSTSSSSLICVPLPNENNNESILFNSSNISIDDEYSTSSSSNNSRQHRLYSSLQNDGEITFIQTKLEKN